MLLKTEEAECVHTGDAVKRALFFRHMWCFPFPGRVVPFTRRVFEGITDAVQLASNPESSSNSKHIGVRHHFLRKLVAKGVGGVIFIRVTSEYQHTDVVKR